MVITIRVPKGRDDLDDKVLSFSLPCFVRMSMRGTQKRIVFFFLRKLICLSFTLQREKRTCTSNEKFDGQVDRENVDGCQP